MWPVLTKCASVYHHFYLGPHISLLVDTTLTAVSCLLHFDNVK